MNSHVLRMASYFQKWMNEDNKLLYFVTTTYLDPKNALLTPTHANRNLERFRKVLLRYLANSHQINRRWFRQIEPYMYAYLDRANSKHKTEKRLPAHESSYHHHSLLLVNPLHQNKLDALTDKIAAKLFVEKHRQFCRLKSLNVQKVKNNYKDVEKVVDYVTSYALSRASDADVLQVYPIAESEFLTRKAA